MPDYVYPIKEATLNLIQTALENGIITRKELLERIAQVKDGEFKPDKVEWTDPYA